MRSLAVVVFTGFVVASLGLHSCAEQRYRERFAHECTCAGGGRR